MDEQFLNEQIHYVQERIRATEEEIANGDPSDKGYKELIECHNKLIDRYIDLLDKPKLESEAELTYAKLDIEQDQIDLEREKFEYGKKRDVIGDIFEGIELTGKIVVPVASLIGVIYVANLAYMNDSKLELCNGRVIGGVKDLFKVLTLKV